MPFCLGLTWFFCLEGPSASCGPSNPTQALKLRSNVSSSGQSSLISSPLQLKLPVSSLGSTHLRAFISDLILSLSHGTLRYLRAQGLAHNKRSKYIWSMNICCRDPHVGGSQGPREWKVQGNKFLCIGRNTVQFWRCSEGKGPASGVGTPHPGEHASRRWKHTGLGFAEGILALDGRVRLRGLCFC